jgi:hypothetical protein
MHLFSHRAAMKLFIPIASILYLCNETVTAFVISTRSVTISEINYRYQSNQRRNHMQKSGMNIFMTANPNENGGTTFDLSKAIYDLYSLRMVRGDAMIQYNLRNQSEPLRINLALIGTLFLICLPSLISEFSGASSSITVIPTTMPLVTPDLSVTIPQAIDPEL